MIKNVSLHLLVCLCLLSACEKKEKPISLPPKGDGKLLQVDMGETYDYQYFISLEQQKVVHVSRVDAWDIAFESGLTQHAVFLNGGMGMAAFNTHKTKFEDVGYADTNQSKNAWIYDAANGSIDSSAIGEWKDKNEVYLIRLNESGKQIRKMQIQYEDALEYKVLVGDVNSISGLLISIPKDGNCNYTYFSFSQLSTVDNIEPSKTSWDLQVTRYHYTFWDQNPPLQYLVNGFLLNPTATSAYKDSLTAYASIDQNFALSVPLSANRDVIGFDWKTYNIDKGIYTIVSKYNYIVHNQNDHTFKLHFLDYYSSLGVKGSPKFEFLQLK